ARIDEGLKKAGAVSRDLDETFEDKPDLLPLISLGLSRDTIRYLAEAGRPVHRVADLQAYNREAPERRVPRGQNIVDLAVRVVEVISSDHALAETDLDLLYTAAATEARSQAAALLATTFAVNEVE